MNQQWVAVRLVEDQLDESFLSLTIRTASAKLRLMKSDEKDLEIFDTGLSNRVSDGAAILDVMQRLHAGDLTAH